MAELTSSQSLPGNDTSDSQYFRTRTLIIFLATIIFGFILFAFPNLLFGITKFNGGLTGINLLYIALFQFISVGTLIYFSLKKLNKNFRFIGLSTKKRKTDSLLGLSFGLLWTAVQFSYLIPNTGGADRSDIAQIINELDGSVIGLISYIVLGVIGGGITEEIYNRGYFINVLKETFHNKKKGTWIAAILSVLFFAIGHLPSDMISWVDILIPSTIYTLLFLYTKRLIAPMVAHSIYNMSVILIIHFTY